MEQPTSASSTALDYRRAADAPRERISVAWLIAAVILATIPVALTIRAGRAAPLVYRITPIVAGAGIAAGCALIALRVVRVRWWAVVVLAVSVLLSVSASAGTFAVLEYRNRDTVLAPALTSTLPWVGVVASFAWAFALLWIDRRGGATFRSRRAKWSVMPVMVLAWLGLSLENVMVYLAVMMFSGHVVARTASPDGRCVATAQRESFLDTSYAITLQGSPFALTAQRIGGPSFDGAGPLGTPSITWSADSRIVELRLGDDAPCFRYDTIAKRELSLLP